MSYAEDLIKLRKKVAEAIHEGVLSAEMSEFYEATLIQVMNEAERQRQECSAQADSYRRQASILDGQAAAFSKQGSIVYNVLNAYVAQARKMSALEAQIKSDREDLEEEKVNSAKSE